MIFVALLTWLRPKLCPISLRGAEHAPHCLVSLTSENDKQTTQKQTKRSLNVERWQGHACQAGQGGITVRRLSTL